MPEPAVPVPPQGAAVIPAGAPAVPAAVPSGAAGVNHNRRGRRGTGGRGSGNGGYASTPTTATPVSTFKGANEALRTLGTRLERKDRDQFLTFQKSLEQYVMTEFKNPADIVVAVRDIADPMKPLMRSMPKLGDLMTDMGLTDSE
jgi:hypothetical protein